MTSSAATASPTPSRQAPGTRPPVESTGDAPGGLMLVAGDSSTGDAPVHAVAGVGFVMRSPVRAIVQIRPRITDVWHYSNFANGLLSYAESQGYWVNFGAWVMCDHGAGATVAPTSTGYRRVSSHLEFVVVQRFT